MTIRRLLFFCIACIVAYAGSIFVHPLDALATIDYHDPLPSAALMALAITLIVYSGINLQNRLFNSFNQPGQPWRRHAEGVEPARLIE